MSSGMLKEIMEGVSKYKYLKKIYYISFYQRADLAVTDLTITSEREEAIDFTIPFMNLGKSIKKNNQRESLTFSISSFLLQVLLYYF